MISTADFRNGIVIIENGELMELVDFQHVKPGKGGAFVRTKQKNVVTGRVIEKTYRAGEKFEEARLLETPFQYLYNDGDLFFFMDHETFEQIPVGPKIVGDKSDWLKENEEVSLLMYEGKVIALNLPITVTLKITRCDPGVQGDRASGGTKPATVETGAAIQVPLFVNEGDTVKIDTRTGQYIERVSTQ